MRYVRLILILFLCSFVFPFNIFAQEVKTLDVEYPEDKLVDTDFDVQKSNDNTSRVPTEFIDKPETFGQKVFLCFIFIAIIIPICFLMVWFFKLFKEYSDVLDKDEDSTENVITVN